MEELAHIFDTGWDEAHVDAVLKRYWKEVDGR